MSTRTNGMVTSPIVTAQAFGIRTPLVSISLKRAPKNEDGRRLEQRGHAEAADDHAHAPPFRSGRYATRSIP